MTSRHGVVNPVIEDVSGWSTEARMRRYLTEALPLGKDAVSGALDAAGLDPADVGFFAVCSCTGYVTPGLDILLARDLGMSPRTQRLFIGHMGCYAALPGLGTVSDFVAARGRPAVLLCLELTSLHVQPPSKDPQQIVAHALFSDAAAAVVLIRPDAPGYRILESTAVTDTTTADHMTWDVTDLGFRMGLSPQGPGRARRCTSRDLVDEPARPARPDRRRRRRLGGPPGRPADPGRGPRPARPARIRERWSRRARSWPSTGTARRRPSHDPRCAAAAGRRRRGTSLMLAFGPGLTLYATLLTL